MEGFMRKYLLFWLIVLAAISLWSGTPEKKTASARLIPLDPAGKQSLPVLRKGETSIALHSGLVSLEKGKSVGEHNTNSYEELIIILKGEGSFEIIGQEPITVKEGEALYCPPFTAHNMRNTGRGELRYIYVVANTVPEEARDRNAHS
jgi:quercetin dioxygenase-like cupin family protein